MFDTIFRSSPTPQSTHLPDTPRSCGAPSKEPVSFSAVSAGAPAETSGSFRWASSREGGKETKPNFEIWNRFCPCKGGNREANRACALRISTWHNLMFHVFHRVC